MAIFLPRLIAIKALPRQNSRQLLTAKVNCKGCQGNALVVLFPTPDMLHTQLWYSIIPLQTDKCSKCWHHIRPRVVNLLFIVIFSKNLNAGCADYLIIFRDLLRIFFATFSKAVFKRSLYTRKPFNLFHLGQEIMFTKHAFTF